jgi:hypothetical protein
VKQLCPLGFIVCLVISSLLCGCGHRKSSQEQQAQASATATSSRGADEYVPGVGYDARLFLSDTDRITFNKQFPAFDKPKLEKDWEWKDVDPLALFSPDEDRRTRRELFLFELSPSIAEPHDATPSEAERAFRTVVESEFRAQNIIQTRRTLKISFPYTSNYETPAINRNLLERTASTGLQWAQVGGQNLYLYNGDILLSKFKSGFVYLADTNIDRPRQLPGSSNPK